MALPPPTHYPTPHATLCNAQSCQHVRILDPYAPHPSILILDPLYAPLLPIDHRTL